MRSLFLPLALLLGTAPLAAQPPYQPAPYPAARVPSPHERRAAIEVTVKTLGEECRPLCEKHRDLAVAALRACKDEETAKKFGVFHAKLDELPDPRGLLREVARHGDDVAAFVMGHPDELSDPARCEAFLRESLEVSLRLLSIEEAMQRQTQQAEQARQAQQAAPWVTLPSSSGSYLAVLLAAAAAVAFLAWRRRRQANP